MWYSNPRGDNYGVLYMFFKKVLLYAGVDKESFEASKDDIAKNNIKLIYMLSMLLFAIVVVLEIICFFVGDSITMSADAYLIGMVMSVLLFILAKINLNKEEKSDVVLKLLFYSYAYIYGIYIGVTDVSDRSVNFMVTLVILPVLIVGRPIFALLINTFFVGLFIMFCVTFKSGEVMIQDVVDAIAYGLFGPCVCIFVNHYRIMGFTLERQLYNSSRVDLLTGVHNRNCFETDLASIETKVDSTVACAYVDANGLHELNNEKGHAAGDEMLRFIASRVAKSFGNHNTYRIGGDEFVAFAFGKDDATMNIIMNDIKSDIDELGYNVAIGWHCMNKAELDKNLLVRTAEEMMYKDKSEFYKQSGKDRRRDRG